ncbi:hypothetical protein, partial [Corynebacterium diphtheriae]|uniref:hypothetical protein n=1 Tax=Corynebacterium diphtheriae TaxID=1717 RepID=UPI001A7E1928
LCAFVDPQCCALLRVGVGTVHNGILQDSVRIPFGAMIRMEKVSRISESPFRRARTQGSNKRVVPQDCKDV